MERLFIYVCHFLCLVFHIAHGTSGRDDSYSWAIAHEDGVELEVDDHGDLEDAAAVLVFSDELLAMMKGFGLDILTLFSGCPELDGELLSTDSPYRGAFPFGCRFVDACGYGWYARGVILRGSSCEAFVYEESGQ